MSENFQTIKGITGGDKFLCRDPLCESVHEHDTYEIITKVIRIMKLKDSSEIRNPPKKMKSKL